MSEQAAAVASPSKTDGTGFAPWRALLSVAIPLVCGVEIAMWLQREVVIPLQGLGEVQRIIEIGRLTAEPFPPQSVVFLGNSITREGIDAGQINNLFQASGRSNQAWNCALSGCNPHEFAVILPRLIAAHPAAVVIPLNSAEFAGLAPFDMDKAYAYGRGGFLKAWPEPQLVGRLPGVSAAAAKAMQSNEVEQLLHFRNTPLNKLTGYMRRVVQPKLLNPAEDNWKDPYEMAFSFSPEATERHLQFVRRQYRNNLDNPVRDGADVWKKLVYHLQAAKVQPLLFLVPRHPHFGPGDTKIEAEYQEFVQALATERNVPVFDARTLLSADEFADGVHPNQAGRKKLSESLAEWLMRRLPSDGGAR